MDVAPESTTSSDPQNKVAPRLPSLPEYGLRLFLNPSSKASVKIPRESFIRNWNEKGLNPVSLPGNETEQAHFTQMLAVPPSSLDEILARQHTIDTLLSDEAQFKNLSKLRQGCYRFKGALEFLLGVDSEEAERASHTSRNPKNRLTIFLKTGLDIDGIEEQIAGLSQAKRSHADGDPMLRVLGALTEHVPALISFAEALGAMEDPVLRSAGKELRALADTIPELNARTVIGTFRKTRGRLTKFVKAAENVSKKVGEVGSLLLAAELFRGDEYCRATFNPDEPAGYRAGWNLLKEKEKSRYSSDRSDPEICQVLNDSPKDTPVTIFCGSNMSGKTFALKSVLYRQLCAQAFGYAPAAEGNFRVYDKFVLLERAATDSANNLSAFGAEIKRWNDALEGLGDRTLFLTDESFSTTSPKDQFKLLLGVMRYLRSRGARVIMANHNEEFLQSAAAESEAALYHFETSMGSNGDIKFLYKQRAGLDESRAFEVARSMGMPQDLLDSAQAYAQGQPAPAGAIRHPKYKPLEIYTAAERASLKLKKGSFRSINPHLNEAMVVGSGEGNKVLDFRFLDRRERSDDWLDRSQRRTRIPESGPDFLMLLSGDQDFHFGFRYTHDKADRGGLHYFDFVRGLLYSGGLREPKRLQERQRLFACAEDLETCSQVEKLSGDVWNSAWALVGSRARDFHGANRGLYDYVLEEAGNKWRSSSDHYSASAFFLQVARENLKFLGVDPVAAGFDKVEALAAQVFSLKEKFDLLWEQELERWRTLALEDRRSQRAAGSAERDKVISEARNLLGLPPADDEESQYHYYWSRDVEEKLIALIDEAAGPHVSAVDVTEDSLRGYQDFCRALSAGIKTEVSRCIISMDRRLEAPAKLMHLLDEAEPARGLLDALRTFDSVETHQLANYFEELFDGFFRGAKSGLEAFNILGREAGRDPYSWPDCFDGHSFKILIQELHNLRALFDFIRVVRQEGYCPVDFNSTGEIRIEDGWNPVEEREKQVFNPAQFRDESRVQLVTGTNMSGKTYDLKKQVWCLLYAHATGYAPARSMSAPVLDGAVYLDRVHTQFDLNLSAFGNEAKLWSELFERARTGTYFVAVDEAFSTTSPSYQAALSYGAASKLLSEGQFLALASHNHDFIDAFLKQNPRMAIPYYFQTHIGEDGQITFDYEKRQGHELSHALLVARKLGLAEEILQIAELV